MGKSPRQEDCYRALHSWNRCHGAFYRAAEADLRWNLEEQSLLAYRAEELAGVPVIVGEATPEGAALGILEKGIWVSLFGEVGAGTEAAFTAAAEELAARCGKARVALGSDEFHFLPGVPADEPAGARLAEACKARGWKSADCADYVGSPAGAACAAYVAATREDAGRRGWTLRLVENGGDRDELTAFLQREFPGRWLREWKFQLARSDTGRTFWNLLRDETGKVLGFSRLAKRGRLPDPARGWTPGAMRLPLSPEAGVCDTDSCLGPIGISASERGRGAGKILLGLSLHELSLQGAELTCIDWTNAYNYYTPLGFSIVRRYLTVWKEL